MVGEMDKNRILGGLRGAVVGDVLGVPVESLGREERKADPVTDLREYGVSGRPKGTWSDDSSLMLCTVESLIEGFNTYRMGQLFSRWLNQGHWTPWGRAFGVGRTTRASITRMTTGSLPESAGGTDESDNGNGSLMRILPVGVYFAALSPSEIIEYAHRASSLTHRHPRSAIACGFYCLMVSSLLRGNNPDSAYREAIRDALRAYDDRQPYVDEFPHFARLLSGWIGGLEEGRVESGGYVIHTLEAAVWCLLTTNTFKEAVLKAINLGGDADTTGAVTGGLAGIWYGSDAIPEEWISATARKDDIEALFGKFLAALESGTNV
jgi:ADP-ribosyl-[dinitrogen reductase] hydrolase